MYADKDLESKKHQYRDQLAFHRKEIERITKALEMLVSEC